MVDENPINSDIVREAEKNWQKSSDALKAWIKEAQTCYKVRDGDQWDDGDKTDDRPCVTFNFTGPYIDAVSGMEISNRQEVTYYPREQSDIIKNELLTDAANWVRDECDAEDAESFAFRDMLTCGVGWTETYIDYLEDPDGKIVIERSDPFSMRWDPSARKRNLADKGWVMKRAIMPLDKIKARWPDSAPYLDYTRNVWDDNKPSEPTNALDAHKYEGGGSTSTEGKDVAVLHYQWKELVVFYRAVVPGQQGPETKEFSEEEWSLIKDDLMQTAAMTGMPFESVRQMRYVVKQAFIAGKVLLEQGDAPCKDSFSHEAMTGKLDNENGVWYGLVRPLIDPQKWTNKFCSTSLFILMKEAKGGLIVEQDAIDNPTKFSNNWAKVGSVSVVKPGAIKNGKIMPKPPATYPQGFDRLMQISLDAFHGVTGIPLELMGLTQKDQAGVLEAQRKQSAITNIAWAFDALRLYRKEQGRLLAEKILNYIADGRLIRIIGDDNAQYVPLLRNQLAMKYDVIVDQSPTSPNNQEKTWGAMQVLMPTLLQAGIPIPPEIVEYAPIPSKLASIWKQSLQPKQPTPEEQQQAQQQAQLMQQAMLAEVQKTMAEVKEIATKAVLNQASAEEKQQSAKLKAAQAGQTIANAAYGE